MSFPSTILHHLQFHEFIDFSSVLEFSKVSVSCHHVIESHIQQGLTFCVPLSSIHAHPPIQFLQHYTNAKRISNKLGSYLFPNYIDTNAKNALPHTLPSLITHYAHNVHGNWPTYYPPSATHVTLDPCFTYGRIIEPHPLENLPPFLTHLSIHALEAQLDHSTKLPHTLKYLHIRSVVGEISFPPSLTHLSFGYDFNSKLDNLPETLLVLKLGNGFNQPVDKLPKNLQKLTFGIKFNQSVDYLPSSLIFLKFGEDFDQPVGKLPASLKKLHFDLDFNQNIDSLPPNLTHLILISPHFTQKACNLPLYVTFLTILNYSGSLIFPESIRNLTLGLCKFDHLPPFLTHLEFDGVSFDQSMYNLLFPLSLKHVTFSVTFDGYVDDLPPGITHISFGSLFTHPVDHLPPSLTHLSFGDNFNQNIDFLPSSLQRLQLRLSFNQPVDNLPHSLLHLDFSLNSDFNQPVDYLPPLLQKIILGSEFNHPLDNLPTSLATIIISSRHFNQNVDHLPPNLTFLKIENPGISKPRDRFNKSVDNLPSTLRSLILSNPLTQHIDNLPPALTFLSITTNSLISGDLDNLPLSLKYLKISTKASNFSCNMDYLPPSLIHLDLSSIKSFANNQSVEYLPGSLTHLSVPTLPYIQNIPPNLVDCDSLKVSYRSLRIKGKRPYH